jgi:hypothetical protein
MSEPDEKRASERRRNPMGDESAEAALWFLRDSAEKAGVAKAEVVYMENYRKIVLNRLKRASAARSDAAAETEARAHPEYLAVCEAQREAIAAHESLFWKRIAAEATIEAWRSSNANNRGAERMR